ncbi:Ekc/Keops Complex Subunit Lage3 [Manis pentadactyla]|nr:Ekc/Keops Complex Subunit Lage3 [Manis pentadactyla]
MVVRAVQKAMVAWMARQAMLELLVAMVPMESLDMVALVTHMASMVQLQLLLLLLLLQGLHLAAKEAEIACGYLAHYEELHVQAIRKALSVNGSFLVVSVLEGPAWGGGGDR